MSALAGFIQQRLSVLPKDKTLFVVFGEQHNVSSHLMLQRMLVSRLIDWENADPLSSSFAVGYELPHNFHEKVMHDMMRRPDLPLPDGEMFDSIDDLAIKSYFKDNGRYFLRFTSEYLFSYYYQNRLAFQFNDMAIQNGRGKDSLVDLEERATQDFIEAFKLPRADGNVDARSKDGLALRNLFMVHRAVRHAGAMKARIYLQHCGMKHVVGIEGEKDPRASLTGLLKQAGQDVLPVIIRSPEDEMRYVPELAAHGEDGFVIFDVDPRRPDSIQAEGWVLEDLLHYSGLPSDIKQIAAHIACIKAQAVKDFKVLHKRHVRQLASL